MLSGNITTELPLLTNTEADSLELSLASIANDPTVQMLVGNMMRNNLEGRLNIE